MMSFREYIVKNDAGEFDARTPVGPNSRESGTDAGDAGVARRRKHTVERMTGGRYD